MAFIQIMLVAKVNFNNIQKQSNNSKGIHYTYTLFGGYQHVFLRY